MAVTEHKFPCTTCGADLRFEPGTGLMICDQCGNQETIEDNSVFNNPMQELDFKAALATSLPDSEMEETRVLTCQNCGAQVEFQENDHATECPFCATPYVTDTGTQRQIKPRGLLPFALSETGARSEMSSWLGSLWFAPNGLQQYARKGRRLDGVYVPYWTFDADTKSRYSGERGTVYYVTRRVQRDGDTVNERVQKVRWRPRSGQVARWFDDVLVLASTSLPKKYTDGLEPWDLSLLEPYRPEYLAGFGAQGYSVELDTGFNEARDYMDRVIQRDVKFDIGGDRQRIHAIDTDITGVTFKHVLLPIWIAAYKYRGRTYRFVVNGRTGRVQGERPWSPWKIATAVVVFAVIAGVVGYFGAQQR